MTVKRKSSELSMICIWAFVILAMCTFNQAHAQAAAAVTARTPLQAASLAVDGKNFRWESSHGVSPSWLTLDLEAALPYLKWLFIGRRPTQRTTS